MVALTTAKGLIQPANSSYVGTWDQPVNANWGVIDAIVGQTATITLNNSPVTLSAAQFQCNQLIFSSTLTGNVAITFPSTFIGPYTVHNICTGSSAFIVTLQTTVAGGQVIGCRNGTAFQVFNDGTNLKYLNLPDPGSYWDWAGSSVPAWVTACTVPPYLNCDGTSFSSATYPFLATILGGTTLPDSKGRYRATLNQGSTRITSTGATSQIDGDTLLAGGGTQTIGQTNLPDVTLSSTGLTATLSSSGQNITVGSAISVNVGGGLALNTFVTITPTISGVVPLGGSGTTIVPPSYVGGITMIRSA